MTITNFQDAYLDYAKSSVPIPDLFNKWASVIAVSSILGKKTWIERGHFQVFPNLYVMLMGEPGSGKGVACDICHGILEDAEYEYFAADRSSKEKFLQDLADGISFNRKSVDDIFANATFGESNNEDGGYSSEPRECLILAEEFQDFLGQNNIDFIAFLTAVWSKRGPYRYRLKTGRSVSITDPCINLLGGTTSSTFALTFPPDIAGQGFLARLILVGGEFNGKRIAFPPKPDLQKRTELAYYLKGIRNEVMGPIELDQKSFQLLDTLNSEFGGVDDPRFKDYNIRRFTQLLKLCIIGAASRGSKALRGTDVEWADNLLRETERVMPSALGSFGKSKNADVSNKILQVLFQATAPIKTLDLWKLVCDDLEKLQDLSDLLHKLQSADRVQSVKNGWLAKRKIKDDPKES